MFYARVIGKVVTSVSEAGLRGFPLLIVQPIDPHGAAKGAPVVATDRVGVGPGEDVLCEVSKEAGLGLARELVPTDASIIARVDRVDVE
jgi:microcompartment protein CcmK/EutM